MLDGFYGDDLDSGSRTTGQNRPFRKRHCGYWDFEQSEPSDMDHDEVKESGKDRLYHRSGTQDRDGNRNSENTGYGNSCSGTKDNWPTGSPDVTWKAGGYGETSGYVDCKNLNYNPKDSKEIKQWTRYRGLDDSLGNFGQPQNWHINHRIFNYNIEDCKETNIYYRDLNTSYHVPGNYTNGQSVDFNGVDEGKEFLKYSEEGRNIYQNDQICSKARIHAIDQNNFDRANKVYDALFANCEYKLQNHRGTDSLHEMRNLEDSGIDKPGTMAPGSRGITPDVLWNQRTRGDQREHYSGIPQGPSLEKNTWHLEKERKLSGPDTWKRNSCLRRTAPSTLRHSEFVQNRKRTQGMNSISLRSIKHGNR